MSPVRIEKDENDAAVGLWVQPQMISRIKGGRPSPKTAAKDEVLIPCDLIVVAIGQGIETRYFEEHGVTVKRGTIEALDTSEIALRDAADRKKDFEPIEYGFSCEEACQESGRCLRCDHFGFGSFRGGREKQW